MIRLEGMAKLTGSERYLPDLPLGDHLWGMVVRSPVPRGIIRKIVFEPAIDWSQFVIVDHRDIPGENCVAAIEKDQPVLASDHVQHVGEAILLLAHQDRDLLRRAVSSVKIVFEEQLPVLDYCAKPTAGQIQFGNDNVFKSININKGNPEDILASAPRVIEGEYFTGAQEHLYIETQGMFASVDESGVLVVRGSLQCPYYVHGALKCALARDDNEVRVIQTSTGGAFGGKEDYPSVIALYASLLTLKAGKPVKIIYDRSEDMQVTTKRHPARIRHRTAVDDDGRLLAMQVEVLMDGGAYVTLSPVVLSRGVIHACGPYYCPHIHVHGEARLTNHPPFGAFRGFGAPQTQFAMERHMDYIASELGIDPVEIRRVNLLRDGQTTSTGQVINDGTDRVALMDRCLELADLKRKREEHQSFNESHPYLRKGIGISTYYHGAGFTGAGETYLASRVEIAALPDGRLEIRTAQTEMGQGMLTVFTEIVSRASGLDAADILIAPADTARVPDSGPTVASRTSMVVGNLVLQALYDLRQKLGHPDAEGQELKNLIADWYKNQVSADIELTGRAKYRKPPHIHWDEDQYMGDAYAAYAWAACAVEVEVDLRSFMVKIKDVVMLQEIGRVLNEVLARGQIQGGAAQAIGWALNEECIFRDGRLLHDRMTDYNLPVAADLPPIRVFFEENPFTDGPDGAKGIGELPMDGPAPAVISAVQAATGLSIDRIPATPPLLLEKWRMS